VTIHVRPFEPGDTPAIRRLNERLRRGGVTTPVYGGGTGPATTSPITNRLFVAGDGAEIRGAVWLREHPFVVGGVVRVLGWLKYPVAESLVDPAFNGVAGSLLLQLLREQPALLALGLGGHATPLARMLGRLGWKGVTVPLWFRAVRPARVLRELTVLRRSWGRRMAAALLANTGVAWLSLRAIEGARSLLTPRPQRGYVAHEVAEFEDWADGVWVESADAYGFTTLRDRAMLQNLYPPGMKDLRRLRVTRDGRTVGWACVVHHAFSVGPPDRSFGRLTVGQLADALGPPTHAAGVVGAATEYLETAGVDVVFSNQLHGLWTQALRRLGYLEGPSNFAFYRAPAAEKLLAVEPVKSKGLHLTRGDCDGPIWY
jgi:hypothetical protein